MLNVFLLFANTFLRLLLFLAALIPQLLQKSRTTAGREESSIFIFGENLLRTEGETATGYTHGDGPIGATGICASAPPILDPEMSESSGNQ